MNISIVNLEDNVLKKYLSPDLLTCVCFSHIFLINNIRFYTKNSKSECINSAVFGSCKQQDMWAICKLIPLCQSILCLRKYIHVNSIHADLHLLICTIKNSIEMNAAKFTKVCILWLVTRNLNFSLFWNRKHCLLLISVIRCH